MSCRILVVDDEESIRFTFSKFLEYEAYQVDAAESLIEAAARVGDVDYDVIFLDILLGRDSGIDLLRVLSEQNPNCQVVMMTGSPEIKTATESVRLNAFDYLVKPIQRDELLRTAKLALDRKTLVDQQETWCHRMTAVFEGIQEGVLIFDEDMVLVDVSASALQMIGCDHEIIGMSLERLSESYGGQMMTNIKEIVSERCMGEIYHMQMVNLAGKTLTVSLTMSPLSSQSGRETGVVLVLRDEDQNTRTLAADTVNAL